MDVLIATLLVFGGLLGSFYFFDLKTNVSILNVLIKTIKPYTLLISICFFVPPLVFVVSNIIAPTESKEYDEKPVYRTLKSLTHLSLLVLGIFAFGWIWALLMIGLTMIMQIHPVMIISSILIIVVLVITTILVENKIKIKYYQFWYWLR